MRLIVADATARFADTHGKWGLVTAWGMSQRLPRRIGTAAAKRMMMTARTVEAVEAKELGLVDMLVPEGALDRSVKELTDEVLANSWHTNFAIKRLMIETDGMSLDRSAGARTLSLSRLCARPSGAHRTLPTRIVGSTHEHIYSSRRKGLAIQLTAF